MEPNFEFQIVDTGEKIPLFYVQNYSINDPETVVINEAVGKAGGYTYFTGRKTATLEIQLLLAQGTPDQPTVAELLESLEKLKEKKVNLYFIHSGIVDKRIWRITDVTKNTIDAPNKMTTTVKLVEVGSLSYKMNVVNLVNYQPALDIKTILEEMNITGEEL